ncbi:MAG: hypothetical protein K1X74_04105 [Pirellulales bacterium]|nr:hypothetical protein [Pirellulales bacterium]
MRRNYVLAAAGVLVTAAGAWAQFPAPNASQQTAAQAAATHAAPTIEAPLPAQYTRLVMFAIPFEPPPASARALEVQLWQSSDQGTNWSLCSKASPRDGKFNFRAPHDGEFWFLVRTLDDQGNLTPQSIGKPEMRVVVDTAPPKLELTVRQGPAGELLGAWQITDPLLHPQGLKLSWTSGDGPWQPLATTPLTITQPGAPAVGEATWWVDSLGNEIRIRAEVTDLAGNVLVSEQPVQVLGSAAANSGTALNQAPPAATPANPQLAASPAPSAIRVSPPPLPPTQRWAADEINTSGLAANLPAGTLQPSALGDLPTPAPVSGTDGTLVVAPNVPQITSSPIAPSVASSYQPTGDEPCTLEQLPAGVVPQFVNTLTFDLHCDLESAVVAGIRGIELWGTRDGGRSWISFGQSSNYRGPLVMTVHGEGVYGFRIVVHTADGPLGAVPTPGTEPDHWVVVDTTSPTVQITNITCGPGAQTEAVTVEWTAADARLDVQPISIDYAPSVGGPWTALATKLTNTGAYTWRSRGRLPERVFLRVAARDQAGNVAFAQTPQNVAAPRAQTPGRIVEVRPHK